MHIVPKLSLQLSGWPAATDAAHVVASTIAAIGLPVIPMRTYRAAGVHTWVVTAQEHPKTSRFTLEINQDVVEILVQELGQNAPVRSAAKGKSKGKSKAPSKPEEAVHSWSTKTPGTGPRPEDGRLDRLEDRFEKLEARQSQFEGRVDTKFDAIQDSLRQLLANTNPRPREATGESPPTKHVKIT